MAIYNLAKGGLSKMLGTHGCKSCGPINEDTMLPIFLQPDNRADGGYGYRDRVDFRELLDLLWTRYGKTVNDLAVGDKIYLFLQPNHSNIKSLFVDFRGPVAGFNFTLSSAQTGNEYTATTYSATYTDCLTVTDMKLADEDNKVDFASIAAKTQVTKLVIDGYSAKVDAVALVITALPADASKLEHAQMLFGRRFEQEGYMA